MRVEQFSESAAGSCQGLSGTLDISASPPLFSFAPRTGGPACPELRDIASIARAVLARRELRLRWFGPELAQDAPWNMLLFLLSARSTGEAVTIKCLWSVSGVSLSTALRIVHALALGGHVRCSVDSDDRRRQLVEIAPALEARLSDYLRRSEPG